MKKTYINPVMDVIEIKTSHQLLAGSLERGFNPGTIDAVEADARNFDLGDDPDEDFDYDFDEEL